MPIMYFWRMRVLKLHVIVTVYSKSILLRCSSTPPTQARSVRGNLRRCLLDKFQQYVATRAMYRGNVRKMRSWIIRLSEGASNYGSAFSAIPRIHHWNTSLEYEEVGQFREYYLERSTIPGICCWSSSIPMYYSGHSRVYNCRELIENSTDLQTMSYSAPPLAI